MFKSLFGGSQNKNLKSNSNTEKYSKRGKSILNEIESQEKEIDSIINNPDNGNLKKKKTQLAKGIKDIINKINLIYNTFKSEVRSLGGTNANANGVVVLRMDEVIARLKGSRNAKLESEKAAKNIIDANKRERNRVKKEQNNLSKRNADIENLRKIKDQLAAARSRINNGSIIEMNNLRSNASNRNVRNNNEPPTQEVPRPPPPPPGAATTSLSKSNSGRPFSASNLASAKNKLKKLAPKSNGRPFSAANLANARSRLTPPKNIRNKPSLLSSDSLISEPNLSSFIKKSVGARRRAMGME